MLSLSLEKYINPQNDPRIYWAKEVTFDYATGHKVQVDYGNGTTKNWNLTGWMRKCCMRLRPHTQTLSRSWMT